jgi:L-amino acid N-acyltransferase YncA
MKSERENIKIRLATDNDFEAIFSIWLDGISNSFEYEEIYKENIKAKFTSNFNQRQGIFNFWVAVDAQNKIWGWQSLIKTSNNPFRENTFAESSTYIAKDNRFKGIGKQLLEYVMNEAEDSQLEYVIGFVALGNEAAKEITKQTGWIEIGQIPSSKKRNSEIRKSFLVRPV